MIEKTLRSYLSSSELITCPVYLEVPAKAPGEFIVLEKTGTSRVNFVFNATFAIQSYSTTLLKACELNEKVKQVMDAMIERSDIAKVSLNSDYNFTDTSTKKYRYQAIYTLTIMEE